MSEHHIEVVRLGAVDPHPNADALDITVVHGGYPCIVKRGQFAAGDLAVYIPEDSLVPTGFEAFAFLASKANADGRARIRAVRLRGIFSMGLLIGAPGWAKEGDDVAQVFDVTRYEPPEIGDGWGPGLPMQGGKTVAPPSPEPPAYDLEPLRKYHYAMEDGEPVVITEKLHGSNGRFFVDDDGRPHVGSRTRWVDPEQSSEWVDAARNAGLFDRLDDLRGICVYFECIGKQGGFPYDAGGRPTARVFDALVMADRRWVNADGLKRSGLPLVPTLYEGPWNGLAAHSELAEGPSTLAAHTREGFVVRPTTERFDARCGRVVLKFVGQGYLLGKKG